MSGLSLCHWAQATWIRLYIQWHIRSVTLSLGLYYTGVGCTCWHVRSVTLSLSPSYTGWDCTGWHVRSVTLSLSPSYTGVGCTCWHVRYVTLSLSKARLDEVVQAGMSGLSLCHWTQATLDEVVHVFIVRSVTLSHNINYEFCLHLTNNDISHQVTPSIFS